MEGRADQAGAARGVTTTKEAGMATSRREFLAGTAASVVAGGCLTWPRPAAAQPKKGVPSEPVKIGVLAIRAGIAAPVGAAGLRGSEWWAERVNKAGGILGRPVQLVVEEESNPKDTVERYRKLILQEKVEVVVGGISTGVTLALGPVTEDMATPWLSWDGTTQKGVEETMPNPKWAFRSVDNEVEAIVGGILTAKYFKGTKTVAGINNDYSYGHDCWQSYLAVLRRHGMDVKPVVELFPKLGVTDFTSHIAAIQQAKPDVLMTSFWSGDATILMKQAAAVGLFKTMKGVFTTAGGVHDSLKKEFTPEGLLLGYNSMYFDDPKGSALLKQFVREYKAKYNEYPPYECDHAYFCAESYKAAVEKAYASAGQWPSKVQVVKALEGIEVESLSGKRSWREDHIQMCNFYQGITTHKNSYDFVTINPVEVVSTKQAMKPTAGTKLFDWINSWKI
jgi:branched-chain amino acid transport system substrate-binding protein